MYQKSSRSNTVVYLIAVFLTVAFYVSPVLGQVADGDSYFDLNLEELMEIVITSPRKTEQRMIDSQVAVTVITADDIRLSGVRSLPEAMTLAPGVWAAPVAGNQWSISLGGFSFGEFANKLLVLLDGVTVYSSLLGNVPWDQVPVTLPEIDRIEVIRGASGVIYGSNAVNGVINIVTKDPGGDRPDYLHQEIGTQGVFASHGGASLKSAGGGFSASFAIGYEEDNGLGDDNGDNLEDGQKLHTLALRTVTSISPNTDLSIDGRLRGGEYYYQPPPRAGFLSVSRFEPDSEIFRIRTDTKYRSGGHSFLQIYSRRYHILEGPAFDTVERSDELLTDLEFQHQFPKGSKGSHSLMIGGGHRDALLENFQLLDGEQEYTVANLYIHDTWTVTPSLFLDLGVKWEDVSLADPNIPWTIGITYRANKAHSFRLTTSAAYRSPTLMELYEDVIYPLGGGATFSIKGNPDLEAEKLTAYELGYRGILAARKLYVDLSVAWKQYENVIAIYEEQGLPDILYTTANDGDASGYAAEIGIDAHLSRRFMASIAYGYFDLEFDGARAEINFEEGSNNQPNHFGRLDISYSSNGGVRLNVAGRYNSRVQEPVVDLGERWQIDARVSKNLRFEDGEMEFGVTGSNIFNDEQPISGLDQAIPRVYSAFMEYRF